MSPDNYMKCPICQDFNPDNSAFCGSCGTTLITKNICTKCGESNPTDSIFCGNCGASAQSDSQSGLNPQTQDINNGRYQTNILKWSTQRTLIVLGVCIFTILLVVVIALLPREEKHTRSSVSTLVEPGQFIEVSPVGSQVTQVDIDSFPTAVSPSPVQPISPNSKNVETFKKKEGMSPASSTDEMRVRTYHNAEVGFTFVHPDEWILLERNPNEFPEGIMPDIELRGPSGGGIKVEAGKEDSPNLKEFTFHRIKDDRNFQVLTTEEIHTIPADLTRGFRVDSGQEVDILTAIAPHWEISIVFTYELDNKEELGDIFNKFIESFQIE